MPQIGDNVATLEYTFLILWKGTGSKIEHCFYKKTVELMTALISFGNNLHLSNLGRLFSVFSFASEKLQNEKEESLF